MKPDDQHVYSFIPLHFLDVRSEQDINLHFTLADRARQGKRGRPKTKSVVGATGWLLVRRVVVVQSCETLFQKGNQFCYMFSEKYSVQIECSHNLSIEQRVTVIRWYGVTV